MTAAITATGGKIGISFRSAYQYAPAARAAGSTTQENRLRPKNRRDRVKPMRVARCIFQPHSPEASAAIGYNGKI